MHSFPSFANSTRRALFIARQGALFTPPARGFARSMADISFQQGAIDALFYAGQHGWRIYLFGTELAVAEGRQTLAAWQTLEAGILENLRAHGVTVARSYAATDKPGGVPGHDKESVYAAPNTGVMHHARQHDEISLEDSWVFATDVESLIAGWRSGCRTVGLGLPRIATSGDLSIEPDLVARDLASALATLGLRPPLRHTA